MNVFCLLKFCRGFNLKQFQKMLSSKIATAVILREQERIQNKNKIGVIGLIKKQ